MKNILKLLKNALKPLLQNKKEYRHAMVGPEDLWKMKRDFQIHFLKSMHLMPKHYLLDIGCGTLRGGIPLIDYLENGHYYGLEVRDDVLKEGRMELHEAGLEHKKPILLHTPDNISRFLIDRKFDYIWAFSVLIHMTDDIMNNTLDFVSKHLLDNGAFYTNVNIGKIRQGNWQGFPVLSRTFKFYSQACSKHGLTVADIGALKDYGHDSGIESQDNQRMLKIYKI